MDTIINGLLLFTVFLTLDLKPEMTGGGGGLKDMTGGGGVLGRGGSSEGGGGVAGGCGIGDDGGGGVSHSSISTSSIVSSFSLASGSGYSH